MSPAFCLLLTATLAFASPAGAQSLDDSAVAAALQAGVSGAFKDLVSVCRPIAVVGGKPAPIPGGEQPPGHKLAVSAAEGLIATLAADAKIRRRPFTVADVPAAMRDRSMLFVAVYPDDPKVTGNAFEVSPLIERVALRARGDLARFVQPKTLELIAKECVHLSDEWARPAAHAGGAGGKEHAAGGGEPVVWRALPLGYYPRQRNRLRPAADAGASPPVVT